jgi:hypothetical protein
MNGLSRNVSGRIAAEKGDRVQFHAGSPCEGLACRNALPRAFINSLLVFIDRRRRDQIIQPAE